VSADPVVLREASTPARGPDGRPLLTSFTAACPLRADADADEVQELLERLPTGARSPLNVPTTHYGRLQVIEAVTARRRRRRPLRPPVLILSADVDGTAEDWLHDVLDRMPDTFASILRHCERAPSDADDDFVERATRYLLAHRLPVALHFVNDPGRTAEEVREAVRQHRRLAGFALGHRTSTPAERRAAFVRAFARPTRDEEPEVDLGRLAPEPTVDLTTGDAVDGTDGAHDHPDGTDGAHEVTDRPTDRGAAT
jgi:hypothetical protein